MDHRSRIKALLCIVVLILCQVALAGAEVVGKKVSPTDKCPVCGMFVAKYPDFVARVTLSDGSSAFFDGVKDMMKYLMNMPKYNPKMNLGDVKAIGVTDYYQLELIDGRQAFYVIGSDTYGPMGKELIPFRTEAAAREFMADHKGKAILRFQDISPETMKELD